MLVVLSFAQNVVSGCKIITPWVPEVLTFLEQLIGLSPERPRSVRGRVNELKRGPGARKTIITKSVICLTVKTVIPSVTHFNGFAYFD